MIGRILTTALLLFLLSGRTVWAQAAFSLPDASLNVAVESVGGRVALYVSTAVTDEPRSLLESGAEALIITLDEKAARTTLETLTSAPWPSWAMALGAFGGQRIVLWGRGDVETVAVFVGDGEPAPVIVTILSERDLGALAAAIRDATRSLGG